ncbi:MAG: ABC transporter permease [Deltaproteobacteria bacterium]|nr:ABC transporter permease [Deltaproteobacteria bacterium]MBW2153761.1 ABC transporter permease [Deltaproteobacteria bacterium]
MTEKSESFFRMTARRFVRHRLAVCGLIILIIVTISAVFAPLLAPYDPRQQSVKERLQGPSAKHWLGTDQFGRDIFSRIIYGGRLSIIVGFVSVSVGLIIGGSIGLLSGYFKTMDNILMRLMDVMLSFPAILLAIVVMAILGPGLINVMIAVGIRSVPSYARVVRSTVLSIKELPYTEASIVIGSSDFRTIFSDILPNSFPPVLVYTTLQIGNAILLGAVLSYLGLGVQPPIPEWGIMVSEGRGWMHTAPLISTFPGLAIFLVVMAFNLIGDGLRDSLDVRLKER